MALCTRVGLASTTKQRCTAAAIALPGPLGKGGACTGDMLGPSLRWTRHRAVHASSSAHDTDTYDGYEIHHVRPALPLGTLALGGDDTWIYRSEAESADPRCARIDKAYGHVVIAKGGREGDLCAWGTCYAKEGIPLGR